MRTLLKTLFLSDRWNYRIARHSLLWGTLLVIFTVIYHDRQDADGSLWQAFGQVGLNSLFFVGYAYVTVFLLIPVILEKRRILLFVLLFLLSGFVISWMKLRVSETVFFQAIDPMQPIAGNGFPWGALVTNTKDMTFVVALFIIVRYSRENYLVRQNLHELRHRRLESEIRLLRNQMDPHVIFNNLNNMYALSLRDPGGIAPHLRQFRSVIRYIFTDSKERCVPLSREIAAIRDYVELEQIRYGEGLQAVIGVKGEPAGISVIPFLLFPFVEHCLTHGAITESGRGRLEITLEVEEAWLRFTMKCEAWGECGDGNVHLEEESLASARRRLQLVYPGRHCLDAKRAAGKNELNIQIPVESSWS